MQSSSSNSKGIVNSLIALSDQYGFGVPISLLKTIESGSVEPPAETTSHVMLRVIITQAERQDSVLLDFLRRIVEKGLEISWGSVAVLSPGDPATAVPPTVKGALIFGVPEHMDFTAQVDPRTILATVSLKAINGDPTVKRQFWLRLQEFREMLTNA